MKKIIGEGFNLRKIDEEDAKSIAQNANNKKIADNLVETFPHPYTLEDAKKYVKHIYEDKESINLGIEIEGKIVGMIGVAGKKDYHKTIGYWLGEKYWGKGIVTKAGRIIIKEAFKNPKLERIEGRVYLHNPASAKVLEKLGFKKEGIIRKDSRIHDGRILDSEVYGLIREDLNTSYL